MDNALNVHLFNSETLVQKSNKKITFLLLLTNALKKNVLQAKLVFIKANHRLSSIKKQ